MTSLMVDTGVSFSSKGAAGAEVPKLLDIPPDAAARTSDLTIRPLGPEPLTEFRDTPFLQQSYVRGERQICDRQRMWIR